MKNPDNKPLRIRVANNDIENLISLDPDRCYEDLRSYAQVLSNLAIAESNLVRAGKDSAMPHFIAIVKELERIFNFTFVIKE